MLSDQDMGEKALGRSCGTKEGLGHKWLGQGLGNYSLALRPQCPRVKSQDFLMGCQETNQAQQQNEVRFAIRNQSSAHTVFPRHRHLIFLRAVFKMVTGVSVFENERRVKHSAQLRSPMALAFPLPSVKCPLRIVFMNKLFLSTKYSKDFFQLLSVLINF